ncbi:MAG: hypothetical protein AAF560_10865, partial [Acidobacteriota bacterium]
MPKSSSMPEALERGAWALLATLLGALLLSSLIYDRAGWPGLLAGEATYLMQARSLAEDFDLTYTRADFDRMLQEGGNPTDLALVSASDGRQITWDRPFPYALYLAPFVGLWPSHGFAFANALLLSLVLGFAARTLARRIGSWSALWVALLTFGSVLYVYVFLATGDLFLFAVTLLAFCLLVDSFEAETASAPAGKKPNKAKPKKAKPAEPVPPQAPWRWLVAGGLLAIPVATEPLYLILVIAAVAMVGRPSLAARAPVIVGFVFSSVVLFLVSWWVGGGPQLLGATAFRFTPQTGFPLVDFAAVEWPQTVRRLSAMHWDGAPRFSWGVDARLWGWDLVYLLIGRSIGLLPYFAPLLLIAVASRSGRRRPLLLAAVAWAVALVILHPFNIYGGEGAVGNRLFL